MWSGVTTRKVIVNRTFFSENVTVVTVGIIFNVASLFFI